MSVSLSAYEYLKSPYCEIHKCQKIKIIYSFAKWECKYCLQDILNRNDQRSFDEQNRGYFLNRLKCLNIPNDLQDKDLNNFIASDDLQKKCLDVLTSVIPMIMKGRPKTNVLLAGPTGTGKSHLAIGMLKLLNEQWAFSKTLGYISSTNLVQAVMDSWKNGSGKNIYEEYAALDFLVIDDLGFNDEGNKIKIIQEVLFLRHTNGKSTLITSNLRVAECFELLGDRLASRFCGNLYKSLELTLPDYRLNDFIWIHD